MEWNSSQRMKVVLFFAGLLLCVIVGLGLLGHVGWWTIFKRVFLQVPVFAILVFFIIFLLHKWGGDLEVSESQKTEQESQKAGVVEGANQASNLGRSLDVRDASDPTTTSSMQVEPEKAAKIIRQMLSEDKE